MANGLSDNSLSRDQGQLLYAAELSVLSIWSALTSQLNKQPPLQLYNTNQRKAQFYKLIFNF